ncbi:transporter [Ganoderma sinense ZZ0214-1]|uniref:Transporter n=1 Tax=Ganoderma sinense ZZ0214-1 TaxID=1077348 RepID=A0A2G8S565_9APHY|nr:transporter [Ganoderma sinense ZZ0214-1]
MSSSTTSPKLDQIVNLPEPLLPTLDRVASFADTHVSFSEARSGGNDTPAGVHLVWSDLRDSISSRPGTDIAFDLVQSTTIHNDDGSVTHLAADVTEFLADLFPAVAREKLMDRVGAVFAGGPSKAGDGTVTVMQSRDEEGGWERTGWEYRLLCAYPNVDLLDHFYTIVATIRYTHEVKREPGFFGLGGSVKHSYKADVVAMRLAVEEGFGLHL